MGPRQRPNFGRTRSSHPHHHPLGVGVVVEEDHRGVGLAAGQLLEDGAQLVAPERIDVCEIQSPNSQTLTAVMAGARDAPRLNVHEAAPRRVYPALAFGQTAR